MDKLMVFDIIHDDAYVRRLTGILSKTYASPGLVLVMSHEIPIKDPYDRFRLDHDEELRRMKKTKWDEESI